MCVHSNLGVRGGETTFQHGDDVGEDPLSQLPNEVAEGPSGHLALVRAVAAEEGEEEGDEGGEDLAEGADSVSDYHLPHVEGCLADHESHI